MRPIPTPELRPSWLGAILFALVIAIFSLDLTAAFLTTLLSFPTPPDSSDNAAAFDAYFRVKESREDLMIWCACAAGCLGAVIAAWTWRSSREVRYHIALAAGIGLLVVTFLHVRSTMQKAWHEVWAGEVRNRLVYEDTAVIQTPWMALIGIAAGLMLVLTALYLDRLPQRRVLSLQRQSRTALLSEPRPSWNITIASALVCALSLGLIGHIYGTVYENTLPPVFIDAESPPYHREFAAVFGWVAAATGAALAVWVCRSPRERRFHISFISGFVCLLIAGVSAHLSRVEFIRIGYFEDWSPPYGMMNLTLAAPGVTWLTATLGLVLIFTALIQDRR
ncbi:MAG TPA: hypothetical protein VK961_09675 [Chthoniobacter sp.]|nr:hypothetical protein [Chthoniobacter sp.]